MSDENKVIAEPKIPTSELDPIVNPTEFYRFNIYMPSNNRSKETIKLLLDHIFKFYFSEVKVEITYIEKFNKQDDIWYGSKAASSTKKKENNNGTI